MRTLVVLCVCLGSLSVRAEALNELGKTAEGNKVMDSDSLIGFSPEADVSSVQHQMVDSSPELSGPKETRRTRHLRTTDNTQSTMGRIEAVWVELNAVLERWAGTSGKLNAILRDLTAEKKHLLDQGEEQKVKKNKEEEEEEEDDDDDEEEEEEDEEEEEEEEEGGEEEGGEEEGGEEAEKEEGEEEAEKEEEESEATNSTLTNNSTDMLPDGCLLEGARMSCKLIGLSHLPVITNLEVTVLEVSGNNLTEIPPGGFDALPNLEELDLSMNILEDSSFGPSLFMNLTNLRRLNLDGNGLTTVPHLPSSLVELKIHNNKINQLASHSFKGLTNLQVLELTGNILYEGSVAPWAFRPLKALKFLRLDKNRFSSIPAGLPPSLEELWMQENQIVEVQDRLLHKCVNLRVLDLSHNHLRENNIYPKAWINMPKLEVLDLSHNQMSVVPSHLPRALRQLSLQHNHIHAIPPLALSHLRPGLEILRLSHNVLEEQRVLGKSFRGVYQTLVELHLDNNRFEIVPRNIRHFKKLQLLHLDHNRIRLYTATNMEAEIVTISLPNSRDSELLELQANENICVLTLGISRLDWLNFIYSVPVRSLCKVKGTEESHMSDVHLEYNYINVKKIPRTAFSCIQDPNRIILEPQTPIVLY